MGFFNKLFGGDKRNKKLAAWGKGVPLTNEQQIAMWELWEAAKNKEVPLIDPLSQLSDNDRAYILKICSSDFRPPEFGSANTLRLASFKYFKEMGFSAEQSAVLIGMMFNMVGRKDL